MLALVSPAKKLDFESDWNTSHAPTQPQFTDDIQDLIKVLRAKSQSDIQSLMKLSDALGALNYQRYQQFSAHFGPDNAKPAIYSFRGDTYVGLDADSLSGEDIDFASDHFRMPSGLYGLLKPMDLMQPYRLEMGTKLPNPRGENLYDFWGDKITSACNDATQGHEDRSVINLASNEYIKSIQPKNLDGDFITCHFKEIKNGAPKVIGLFAKRARGAMARYIIQNRIENPEGLKSFDRDGYKFFGDLSDAQNFVFLRDQEAG